MFRLTVYRVAIIAAGSLAAASASAQNVVNFLPTGAADWGVGANWSDYGFGNNPPEGQFEEVAVIGLGGTAQVTTAFPVGTDTGPNGPGRLEVQNGTVQIQNGGLLGLSDPGSLDVVDRAAVINDRLHIQGGGQLLNAQTLTFGSGATYKLDLTPATTSPIEVNGAANLGGSLELDFSGVTAAGSYPLISAGSISGDFTHVSATGIGAAQTLSLSSAGGVYAASLNNVPVLTIDRDTGAATIENPHGSPYSLDGFSIRSALGALDASAFSGLPRSGWENAGGNSANIVADTYEGPSAGSPSDALPSSTPLAVAGAGFWTLPAAPAFLQATEELIFEVTDPTLGPTPVRGIVEYTGTKVVNNNIVLYIDNDGADAGQAAMLNSTGFAQGVEVYRVSSSGSPLQTDSWIPLEGQSGLDNDTWQVSAQSNSTALLEVTEEGSSVFDRFTRYDIGQILDSGFSESGLTFEFLLDGDSTFTLGEVVFVSELPDADPANLGDFNGDGIVNAADYTLWRDNLGDPDESNINGAGDGGGVTQSDYLVWRDNYGVSYSLAASTAQAPEPASMAALAVLLFGVCCRRVNRLMT